MWNKLFILSLFLFCISSIEVAADAKKGSAETTIVLEGTDSIFQSTYDATRMSNSETIYSVSNSCSSNNGNFILGEDQINDETTQYHSLNRYAAVRFANVSVPYNSVIQSATMKFVGSQATGGKLSFLMFSQNSANAPSFLNTAGCLSSLPLSSSNVSFQLSMSTPPVELNGLTPIVQEVVSNWGWRRGNSFALIGVLQTMDAPFTELVVQYAKRITLELVYTYDQCINVTCHNGAFCNDTNTSGLPEWECVYNLCVLNSTICPSGYLCVDPDPRIVSNDKKVSCTLDECTVNNGNCLPNFSCLDTDIHQNGGVQCFQDFVPAQNSSTIENSTSIYIQGIEENENTTAPPRPEYMSYPFRVVLANNQSPADKDGIINSYFKVGSYDQSSQSFKAFQLEKDYPLTIEVDLSLLSPPISLLHQQGDEWVDAMTMCGGYSISGSTLTVPICDATSVQSFDLVSQKSASSPFLNSYLKVNCINYAKVAVDAAFNNIDQTSSTGQWMCAIPTADNPTICIPAQQLASPLLLQRVLTGTPGKSFPLPSVDVQVYNCTVRLANFSKKTIQFFRVEKVPLVQYSIQRIPKTPQLQFVASLNQDSISNMNNEFALVENFIFGGNEDENVSNNK